MPFVSIPLKGAESVDFNTPVSKFLTLEGKADVSSYLLAVAQFNELREACVVRSPEKHDSGLRALQRYYAQLSSLLLRMPVATSQTPVLSGPAPMQITFKWFQTLDKSKKKQSQANANFEKICVLFNIAALHSQIAEIQNLGNDEGLKSAFLNFQGAAIVLNHLVNSVQTWFGAAPFADFEVPVLRALIQLMLAQAHEVFWSKAKAEKKSNLIISKLAMQTSNDYGAAAKLLAPLKDLDRSWAAISLAKMHYFRGEACYRLAMVQKAEEEHGVAVARLTEARDALDRAAKAAANTNFDVKPFMDLVGKELAQTKKDNDLIFTMRVPSVDSLPDPENQGVASADKPLPDYTVDAIRGPDFFEKFVPIAISADVASYIQKRDDYVSKQVATLRELTQRCVGTLSDLSLPGAIQALENPSKLPEELARHAQEIQAAGGIKALTDLLDNIPKLSKACVDILDECSKMLEAEEKEDQQMREAHGERWTRAPSRSLTDSTLNEANTYGDVITKAAKSDETVRNSFKEHQAGIALLCKTEAEILREIPNVASRSVSEEEKTCLADLKGLLAQMDVLRSQRDQLETQFNTCKNNDDISSQLMGADSSEDRASMFESRLASHYQALVTAANDNLAKTHAAIDALIHSKSKYDGCRQTNSVANEREKMLSSLSNKFEQFKKLKLNLEEGTKFYGSLATLLLKFKNKVSDFTQARKVEKTQLMSDITQAIAKSKPETYMAHSTPPAIPPQPQAPPPMSSQPQQPPPHQQPSPVQGHFPPAQPQPQQPIMQSSYYTAPPPSSHQGGYNPNPAPYQPPQSSGYNPYAPPPPQQQNYGQPFSYSQPYQPQQPQPQQHQYQAPQYQQPAPYYQPNPTPAPPQQFSSPMSPVGGEWSCSRCTFHNSPYLNVCEMCGSSK